LVGLAGCASMPVGETPHGAEFELTLVRMHLEDVHRSRDVTAFGALHTDGTVYEWRGHGAPVTGRTALESSTRAIWAKRQNLHLSLQVSELQIHAERAYEFGSYEETWIDSQGRQVTEFGRYVAAYSHEADGEWRIAR